MTPREYNILHLMEQNGEFDDEIESNKKHRIEKVKVWIDRPQQAPEWFFNRFEQYTKAVKE